MIKLISLALIVLLFSCGVQEKQVVSKPDTIVEIKNTTPVETPKINQGIVTYLSGEVTFKKNDIWEIVDIGQSIKIDDFIKTAKTATCEIQFGKTIVKIQENTEIFIKTLALDDKTQIGLNMQAGSVLAKVQKLSGGDKFQVKTGSAVCGVRGTEFGVTADSKGTTLAVKEGRVAVLPKNMDIDSFKEKMSASGTKNEQLEKTLDKIESSAVVVEKSQQVVIDQTTIAQAENKAKVIEQAISQEKSLDRLIEIEVAKPTIEQPKQISQENENNLKSIDKMKIIEIPVALSVEKAKEQPIVKVFKFGIDVEPFDASIRLNNDVVGVGRYSGIFKEGETLSFIIEKEGFKSHTFETKIDESTAKQYKFTLLALPQKEVPQEKPKEPLRVSVTIKSNVDDALIFINDQLKNKGIYTQDYVSGTDLNIKITRDGYEDVVSLIKVSDSITTKEYILKAKLIENRIKLDARRVIGMVYESEKIIAVDRFGTLYAIATTGGLLWSLNTNNSPNENSVPIVFQNKIYFSGGKEFLILDLNGKVLYKTNLDTNSSHLFGRRVVPVSIGLLFPTNSAVNILDLDTGRLVKSVPVPGGSQMSPVFYKDNLLIANQQGTLLMIDPRNDAVNYSSNSSAIQPLSHQVVVSRNKAIFVGRKGSVVCFDLETKKLIWQRELNTKTPPVADLIIDDRSVYIHADQAVRAISLTNGSDSFSAIRNTTAPTLYKNRLYFGKDNSIIIADAKTGYILTTIATTDKIIVKPIVVNNKIYTATANGEILIINIASISL